MKKKKKDKQRLKVYKMCKLSLSTESIRMVLLSVTALYVTRAISADHSAIKI